MKDTPLDSWKEIAAHLGRSVRTVQRWEKHEGLPVHRHAHAKQGTVYGYRAEIDAWWETRRTALRRKEAPAASMGRSPGWTAAAWITAALAVLAVGAAAWKVRTPEAAPEPLRRPIVTSRGWKFFPTLKPDGSAVAFTWSPPGSRLELYVQTLGEESPRRLTRHPGVEMGAAWSPDSKWIAFLRGVRTEGPTRDLIVAPAEGGVERILAKTAPDWGPFITWSPNSQALIYPLCEHPKPCALMWLDLQTSEQRSLTIPPEGPGGDTAPALSSDGTRLLFVRRRGGHTAQVHIQHLDARQQPQGEPQPITPDDVFATAPVWAANDRDFFYVTGEVGESMRVWRQSATRSSEPRSLGTVGEGFFEPGLSAQGGKLVAIDPRSDVNVRRLDVVDGKAFETQAPLTKSTRIDDFPHLSPDGKKFVFHSTRDGGADLYIMGADGSDLVRLTSLGTQRSREPRWSPDGKRIVFTAGPDTGDLFIVESDGRNMRLLLGGPEDDFLPSWSPAGEIYFTSTRSGSPEVWRIPSTGGEPVRVTKNGGYRPIIAPDGRTMYYTKRGAGAQHGSPLYRAPAEGGPEEIVFDSLIFHPENFHLLDDSVYYTGSSEEKNSKSLRMFNLGSGEDRELIQLGNGLTKGLSVSQDGRVVLFSQADYHQADIVLFEDF